MLNACSLETAAGIRNRAIISLLYDSGLRAAEICRLPLLNVNFDEGKLWVRVKGGNEEIGWFGKQTADRIRAWLRVRVAAPGVDTLFTSVGGNTRYRPLTPGALSATLRKISRQAEIPTTSAHAFRRGFAVKLTTLGIPNSVVQDLGRWSSQQMVKRYTMGLNAGTVYLENSPVDNLS
jgi:integrase